MMRQQTLRGSVLREDLTAVYSELTELVLDTVAGQSSAMVAGIRAARGNWIATLDADLQSDPADLIRLWNALPGHDVALGWRLSRQDVWSKLRDQREWANRVRNMVLGQSIRDTGCSVRKCPPPSRLIHLPTFDGVHRFLRSTLGSRRMPACAGASPMIDPGPMAGRTTTFGTALLRWSWTCLGLPG